MVSRDNDRFKMLIPHVHIFSVKDSKGKKASGNYCTKRFCTCLIYNIRIKRFEFETWRILYSSTSYLSINLSVRFTKVQGGIVFTPTLAWALVSFFYVLRQSFFYAIARRCQANYSDMFTFKVNVCTFLRKSSAIFIFPSL